MPISDEHEIVFNSNDEKEAIISELNKLAIDGNCVFRGYNKQSECGFSRYGYLTQTSHIENSY